MQYLKADTVTEVLIGPVVAVGDGFTPVTSLTIAGADEAEIIKHGATTVTAITGTLAAITSADGYYALDLVTGDVDTEGRLTILINDDSLCLPVRHDFMVVNANVFDSLFAAATTDYLQTDAVQWIGTACATPTVNGVPEVDLTHVAGATTNVSALATNVNAIAVDVAGLDGAAMRGTDSAYTGTPPTAASIADAVWDEAATGHVDAGKAGEQLWTDVDAILVDTAEIGAAGAGLTNINLPDQTMDITGSLSGSVGSVSNVANILTTALTESYATDGATATLSQLLYMILSAVGEFSISGTTITCKKLDGSTTAMTFTLDDGTNPTSRTRAT